jgi:hypothetical protein
LIPPVVDRGSTAMVQGSDFGQHDK